MVILGYEVGLYLEYMLMNKILDKLGEINEYEFEKKDTHINCIQYSVG